MNPDILIRYKGGSGGNTMCWYVGAALNDCQDINHDQRARMIAVDQFRGAFVSPVPADHLRSEYNLPNCTWHDMDQHTIGEFVRSARLDNPYVRTGLTSYHFNHSFDMRTAFPQTLIVDIIPNPSSFWLVQAMQIYKDACRKMHWVDRNMDEDIYPGKQRILEHHAEHGWYPAWWLWFERKPIGDFSDFLADRGTIVAGDPRLVDSDLTLDAVTWLTDTSLGQADAVMDRLGLVARPEMRNRLRSWVQRNLEVLDILGLNDYIDKTIDMVTQRQILQNTFLPRYQSLIEADEE